MSPLAAYALALLVSYALGAVPFGLVFARLRGVDLRAIGSGNIGATNVGRALGMRGFFTVLMLDAGKGVVSVLGFAALGAALAEPLPDAGARVALAAACGLAAVVGHVFPIYLRFSGGKGVATAAGVFAALAPIATGVALGTFALVLGAFRRVSLASLTGAAALVLAQALRPTAFATEAPITGLAALVFALMLWRHRGNLARLLAGTEPRVGRASAAAAGGSIGNGRSRDRE